MNPCHLLQQKLGSLFSCSELNGYTRIRTPFLYPDGDVIDLFLCQQNDSLLITDLGETSRWLRSQTLSLRRSPKQNHLIQDICLNHGLEFKNGMLQAQVNPHDDFPSVLLRVAQGALRVADLWFTLRTRSIESLSEEIEVFLSDKGIHFIPNPSFQGRSGRSWRLDFQTQSDSLIALVSILSTGSRSAAKSIAEHTLATWFDLSHLQLGSNPYQFVSLFDDSLDVWSEQDFKLLNELSIVTRWSQPQEFLKAITSKN